MLRIGIPQDFTNGHRSGHRINSDDVEGEPGFIRCRKVAFHRRIHPEGMQCNAAIWTGPVIELGPVAVAMKIRRKVRMSMEELFPLHLFRNSRGFNCGRLVAGDQRICQKVFKFVDRVQIMLTIRINEMFGGNLRRVMNKNDYGRCWIDVGEVILHPLACSAVRPQREKRSALHGL